MTADEIVKDFIKLSKNYKAGSIPIDKIKGLDWYGMYKAAIIRKRGKK